MIVHIDYAKRKNCWNIYDSYSGMCIGCGCCSHDLKKRYEERLKVCKRLLQEQLDFDNWIEGLEHIQRKNVKANIRYFKRRIKYYRKRLEILEDGEEECLTEKK